MVNFLEEKEMHCYIRCYIYMLYMVYFVSVQECISIQISLNTNMD